MPSNNRFRKVKILLIISTLLLSCIISNYVYAATRFIESQIGDPSSIGTVTVDEFIEVLKNYRLPDGSHPKVKQLKNKGNIYTLEAILAHNSISKFTFEHLLNYDGVYSTFEVSVDGKQMDSRWFLMNLLTRPRDDTKYDRERREHQAKAKAIQDQQDKINKQEAERRIAIERQKTAKALKEQREAIERQEIEQQAIIERQRVIEENRQLKRRLDALTGSFKWTGNGGYWDGDTKHPDDIINKSITVSYVSDSSARISFISKINNNIICNVETDAIYKLDSEVAVETISLNDCAVRFDGRTLHYRGSCDNQCNTSNAKKEFASKLLPNGEYEKDISNLIKASNPVQEWH